MSTINVLLNDTFWPKIKGHQIFSQTVASHRASRKTILSIIIVMAFISLVMCPTVITGNLYAYPDISKTDRAQLVKSLLKSNHIYSASNISQSFNQTLNLTTGIFMRGKISAYLPGEPVHLFFQNGNKTAIFLNKTDLLKIEMNINNNSWETIYSAPIESEEFVIPPGGLHHWVWYQRDYMGSQVPEGKYRVSIIINKMVYTHKFLISRVIGKLSPGLLNKVMDEKLDVKTNLQRQFYVIVTFTSTFEKISGNYISRLMKEIGYFNITAVWENDLINAGFSATLNVSQILSLARNEDVVSIEYSELRCALDTAKYYTNVNYVVQNYGVTGDRDGNENSYSKNDVVIAILDTGVNPKHVDLDGGKIIAWKDFVNNEPNPYDDNGHGTHVASIAVGTGEANPAYKGVAPGAALVVAKVLNSDGWSVGNSISDGLKWIKDNKDKYGIDIVSISIQDTENLGAYTTFSQAVDNLVRSGLIVVVAAGNCGPDSSTVTPPGTAFYAITVGAVADPGEGGWYLADFSGRGPTKDNRPKPDVVAPGVNIMAAMYCSWYRYWPMTGTSMATPFVAGLIALLLDYDYTLKTNFDTNEDGNPDVKELLMGRAIDMGSPGRDYGYGAGRADAKRYTDYLSAGDQGANSQFASSLILWGEGQKWIHDEPIWVRDTVDWYKVYAHGGDLLAINCVPETDLDIAVYLVDRYGHTITYVDPARGYSGLIEYNVPMTDYYFIKIVWQDWASQYDLYVSITVS
ncbi:MAG: S8 family peptidase [Candidatus Odinarchaeota archaeon]|nr:S8 family peptidase [Candidatus Odinarchaeota archaeon]